MRGIPEILLSRILVFMWSFGALHTARLLQVARGRRPVVREAGLLGQEAPPGDSGYDQHPPMYLY